MLMPRITANEGGQRITHLINTHGDDGKGGERERCKKFQKS